MIRTKAPSNGTQLPLAFGQSEIYSFSAFQPGQNSEVVDKLKSLLSPESLPWSCLFLWGGEGVGKSHLLHALCGALSEIERPAVYLPLNQKQKFAPAILDGLENVPYVCLDDIEQICGDIEWERALFNLFNTIRDREQVLVMSARVAPAAINFQLPDLASRLNGSLIYQLQDLNDAGKLAVLKDKARARSFELSDEVAEYLIKRLPRNMHTLSSTLTQLDEATLAAKRRLTIPFVRSLFESS